MTHRLLLVLLVLGAASSARCLPQYPRLFQAKYRYRPNCTLCHVPDNWELNRYGVEFFKRDRILAAFAEIEPLDADRDGQSSLVEILARANPGDPASTSGRPGRWLEKLIEPAPPKKHLKALFPDASSFRLREAELTPEMMERVKGRLGRTLSGEESLPVFFEALKDGRVLGEALYASNAGRPPCFFLVGYRRPVKDAKTALAGLRVLSCSVRDLRRDEFLDQFAGRPIEDMGGVRSPRPDYEQVVNEIASMVRAGGAVIREVRP